MDRLRPIFNRMGNLGKELHKATLSYSKSNT